MIEHVLSAQFAPDVAENWQSEFLQFAFYIVATVWLVQRGSSESKKLDEAGPGGDEEQKIGRYADPDSPKWVRAGGWRTALYGRSLGTVMAFFFLASLRAQSVAGRAAFNSELLDRNQDSISWLGYITSADFWNWRSEFLAVAAMAAFAI